MKNMAPLQIETVNGQVAHTINNHHHTHHHQHSHTHHHRHHHTVHAHGPVHVHNHVTVQDEFALQAPPAPPARVRQPSRPAYDVSPAQKALLALMRGLPKEMRGQVLDFMRIEFGTGMVVDLNPEQLQRVRRFVLDVRRTAGL